MPTLILFFDGYCPLCVNEVQHLRRLDKRGVLQFEDIQHPGVAERWPQIDNAEAGRILLELDNGTLFKGLDVTHRAWSLMGLGWLTAPLRWPLLSGSRCTDGRCQPPRRPDK